MNKHFLKYLIKSNKTLNIFLIILNLIFSSWFFFGASYNDYVSSNNGVVTALCISYFLIVLECIILPIIELSFINNRKRIDIYYTLPIKHEKLVITTILEIIFKIVLMHIITIIPVLIANAFNVNILMFIIYIFLTLIVVGALVLFTSALCLKTNSSLDAILVTLGYIFIPIMFYLVVNQFEFNHIFGKSLDLYHIIEKMMLPFLIIDISYNNVAYMFNIFNFEIIDWIIIILMGIFGYILIRYELRYRKAERAEELSNNILTYPLVISTITLLLILLVLFSNIKVMPKILFIMLIYAAYAIMNFIYQRRIIFTKKSAILFGITIVCALSISYIANITEGFGINYSFKDKHGLNNISMSYTFYSYGNKEYSFSINYIGSKDLDKLEDYIKDRQANFVELMKEDHSYDYSNGFSGIFKSLVVNYDDGDEYYYNGGQSIILNKENLNEVFDEVQNYLDLGVKLSFHSEQFSEGENILKVYDNFDDFKKIVFEQLIN